MITDKDKLILDRILISMHDAERGITAITLIAKNTLSESKEDKEILSEFIQYSLLALAKSLKQGVEMFDNIENY